MKVYLMACLDLFIKYSLEIIQKYGDWYMTSDGVYIRMTGRSKALYWLQHFVPNKLFLQEMAYQTYIHGVVTSLHKEKKSL